MGDSRGGAASESGRRERVSNRVACETGKGEVRDVEVMEESGNLKKIILN